MPQPKGRTISLSLPRRFVCDLVHFAQKVPSVPVQRRMCLAEVAAARQAAARRPSWCAIFTKAYGLVCAATPELRRAFIPFPRSHLYEHPIPVASIAIERRYREEAAVFAIKMRTPDQRSLGDIEARLRHCMGAPIERIGTFRKALRVSALPRPLRRLLWWFGLNLSGRRRAQYMGTFGVTMYGGLGASSLHPLSPLTTTLNTGFLGEDGSLDVRLIYDHRVLDGATVARALRDLEQVLQGEILRELRFLRSVEAA